MIVEKCNSYGHQCPCLDCGRECAGCVAEKYSSFDTEKLCTLAKAYCEEVNGKEKAHD